MPCGEEKWRKRQEEVATTDRNKDWERTFCGKHGRLLRRTRECKPRGIVLLRDFKGVKVWVLEEKVQSLALKNQYLAKSIDVRVNTGGSWALKN